MEIGGSTGVLLQAKSVDITENGTSVVAHDDGFDGLKSVEINTNVPKRFECGDAYFRPPNSSATSISLVGLLQKIDVSCWDTSKVKSMYNLFANCSSLQSLDVISWDISSVTYMNNMFTNCSSLKYLDVSSWDTSKVGTMNSLFANCFSLCTLIGNKTLQDVENGIVALRGTKLNIQTNHSPLRFSSILALANGLADLTGETAQTLKISAKSYNNMYNDDDTIPTADVIAERQARIAAICAAKNWNFAH